MKLLVLYLLLAADHGDWPVYGHDAGGTKYSPLSQINRANVSSLKPAWTFHAGDMYAPTNGKGRPSGFETTPLYIDGTLYLTTAFGRLIALDPITGKERWNYAPHVNTTAGYGDFVNRGAATWVDSKTKQRRFYVATIDAQLIAIHGETGKPIEGFGKAGFVDLRKGLRNAPDSVSEYEETSPPAVIGDVVVVGSGVADNNRVNAASGEVRGFDARTGKLLWTFDPMPGTKTGAANRVVHNLSRRGAQLGICPYPEAPALITTAANAWATISTRTPWWLCAATRAKWCGAFKRSITICGTTMWHRSPR